jgi:DNA-binding NtrC family response regulator
MTSEKSILLVDDEANLRSTLTLILQREGYQTRAAVNGREALDLLSKAKSDLILLDLKMPGIDGMQLLQEIQRLDPDIPVLILTANASLDSAEKAIRSGASGYLLKPIEPEQIILRIREIFLEQRQLKRRQEIVREIQGIVADIKQMEM